MANDSQFIGFLTFHAAGAERLDSQTCKSKKDAKSHAEHMASEYGVSIDIKRDGKVLCTVREYGS